MDAELEFIFFLNHRISSVLPCDFILKYDDDQWPNDNRLQEYIIKKAKNQNDIIGIRGFIIQNALCGYSPKNITKNIGNIQDHVATPLLVRPGYFKLDARNNIFKIFCSEDVALSLNSYQFCNVSSKKEKMNIIWMQNDGNSQAKDMQIISAGKNEKKKDRNFDFFFSSYCFLIHSGYIPKLWKNFKLPQKDFINITINHKTLY